MFRRLFLSLAIALLGLGTVVHGVSASVMEMEMAMAAGGHAPCDACDGGTGDSAACGASCAAGAALPSSPSVRIDAVADARPSGQIHGAGSFSGPPDPYPPRP